MPSNAKTPAELLQLIARKRAWLDTYDCPSRDGDLLDAMLQRGVSFQQAAAVMALRAGVADETARLVRERLVEYEIELKAMEEKARAEPKTFDFTEDGGLIVAALLLRFGGRVEIPANEAKHVIDTTTGFQVNPVEDADGRKYVVTVARKEETSG